MRFGLSLAALVSLAAVAASQNPFAVGTQDVAWTNSTGQGAPTLYTRVLYPSPTGGVGGPVEPNPSGWPVIVFLHGYGLMGRDYVALGKKWASQGFAVVQPDTSQWNYLDQVADGTAVLASIRFANRNTGTHFAGAFDTQRIAIAGHSMGGGTMGMILANNPGYRCGLALAPVFPGVATASQVAVPFGLVSGMGDTITPPPWFSQPYYQAVAPQSGLKFWYLMDQACDHMNLVGLDGGGHPSFERAADIGLGFFRHFMDLDAAGLDHCIGPVALADHQLVTLTHEVAEPRIWAAGRLKIGRTVRISLTAEEGMSSVLAAPSAGWATPTPLGTLQLDPGAFFLWTNGLIQRDRRIDMFLTVPNHANLIGTTIAMQGIGPTTASAFWLGSATEFRVVP